MSSRLSSTEAAPLPDDVAALKALLLSERAMAAKLAGQNEQLRALIKELQLALLKEPVICGNRRTGGRI